MIPKKKLPLYILKINPEKNILVDQIAICGKPAIESNLIYFSKQTDELYFKADEERFETISAVMIPNLEIYRRDSDGTEYDVLFLKEDVRKIAQVFMQRGFQNNLNINHQKDNAGMTVWQSYVLDFERGVNAPKGMESLPDGSWIIGTKVHDASTWERIKSGELKGFSIQGIFEFFAFTKIESALENRTDVDINNEIMQLINKIKSKNKKR